MEVRTIEQRKRDTLTLLRTEVDCWVASASSRGEAYLVPLSFLWDDDVLVMATPERSVTARNLLRSGRARIGVGPTRDVAMIEGTVEPVSPFAAPGLAERHAEAAGFDARQSGSDFILLVIRPENIQAWRNPAELENRYVMRGGQWVS